MNKALLMDFEEDTYSSIFLALKHPVRRKILRMLGEDPASYTEILNKLGVESGFLNYHLESLSGLIAKDKDGRYCVSKFGEAALGLVTGVEEPVKRQSRRLEIFGFKINPAYISLAFMVILIVSNVYWVHAYQGLSKDKTNVLGGAIIQTRGLLGESIDILDTTIKKRSIHFSLWNILFRNLMLATRQLDLIKSLDIDHLQHWSQIELTINLTTDLISDIFQRYDKGDFQYMNITLGEGWMISSMKIRDGLVEIDKALSSEIIIGAHPHVEMTDKNLTTALEAAIQLQMDVELARRALNIPKTFLLQIETTYIPNAHLPYVTDGV
jgi:DNA-binding transcriptional ArsR family regulator